MVPDGFRGQCAPPPLPVLVHMGTVHPGGLPRSPLRGWTFFAAEDGVYGGLELRRGDAVVCAVQNPPLWLPLSGAVALASASEDGLMSASDKAKLDSVEAGANLYVLPKATDVLLGGVYVDPALDRASDNPVENRAISGELDGKANAADILVISNAEIFGIVTGG